MQLLDRVLIEPIHCELPAFEAGEIVQLSAKRGREAMTLICEAVRKLQPNYSDQDIGVIAISGEAIEAGIVRCAPEAEV